MSLGNGYKYFLTQNEAAYKFVTGVCAGFLIFGWVGGGSQMKRGGPGKGGGSGPPDPPPPSGHA